MLSDRRRFLMASTAVLSTLAGCGGGGRDAGSPAPEPTESPTPEPTASPTPTPSGSGGPPGADMLGSGNDLRSSASVRAAALSEDRGAGRFVFTPAVVWVESGATVTWDIEGAAW